MALIFVMIDGVGLAPTGSHNPVAARFPQLSAIIGAPLTDQINVADPTLLAKPIDATLNVPGLPQSGSGHAAIWGGFNAAALNGRHQPSYPTIAMRERLAEHNLLLAARRSDRRVAWANAYLPGYDQAIEGRRLRHTAGTWAALQTDLALRGLDELHAGTAVSWDVTQRLAQMRLGSNGLPLIAPEQAGSRLAALARSHDLVAFETYLPDLAAHERIPFTIDEALDAVDGLLAGTIRSKHASDTVIVTSDHGNSEDTTTRIHTRNPVPLLVFGPAAPQFAALTSIDQITPTVLAIFN